MTDFDRLTVRLAFVEAIHDRDPIGLIIEREKLRDELQGKTQTQNQKEST
jgi:hypothetical protein